MFISCGEAVIDMLTSPGTFDIRAALGGSPLNVAIGLARLGYRSAFLGCLSRDTLGRTACARLEGEGVDVSLVTRTTRPSTLALVGSSADGSPDYGFHGLEGAPAPLVPPSLPDWCRVVHLGSVGAALGPSGAALEGLARREHGIRLISYDPNVRLAVEPRASIWCARVAALASCADLIKVSAEDLAHLGMPEGDAAGRWLRGATRLMVVTDGPRGARAYTRGSMVEVAAPRIDVVDTVGAGDSFQAALLAGCADHGLLTPDALDSLGRDGVASLLEFAVLASALTCSRAGADPPRRRDGSLFHH